MDQPDVLTPELDSHIRRIVLQTFREEAVHLREEIRDEELGQLRQDMNWQFDRVWQAIEALTEAQKSTDQRVSELVEAQKRTEQRVSELAEAQKRTEQRVSELAEAQKRTEQRVSELAEAQMRTEQRLNELAEAQKRTEQRVSELAEAQMRTEQRLNELAEAQRRTEVALADLTLQVNALVAQVGLLSKQVGQLSNRLGLEVEVDAEEILLDVLANKNYRLLEEPQPITVNGEVDLIAHVETPQGERLWVVTEVKARVRRAEVGDWLQQLKREWFQKELRRWGIEPPYLPYIFGLRIYHGALPMAEVEGLGVLDWRGERLSPRLWTGE